MPKWGRGESKKWCYSGSSDGDRPRFRDIDGAGEWAGSDMAVGDALPMFWRCCLASIMRSWVLHCSGVYSFVAPSSFIYSDQVSKLHWYTMARKVILFLSHCSHPGTHLFCNEVTPFILPHLIRAH